MEEANAMLAEFGSSSPGSLNVSKMDTEDDISDDVDKSRRDEDDEMPELNTTPDID